jgi:glutamate--cysteine ligase
VRLKRILEMRGADGGPWARLCALPALWTGLLYDEAALAGATALVADWTMEERESLRTDVPRQGLATRFRGRPLKELALPFLELARDGLKRRARLDTTGQDESHFIEPLFDIAQSGKTPADRMVERYRTRWGESVDPVYVEEAY